MDCTVFDIKIDRFIKGKLGEGEFLLASTHINNCYHCQQRLTRRYNELKNRHASTSHETTVLAQAQ